MSSGLTPSTVSLLNPATLAEGEYPAHNDNDTTVSFLGTGWPSGVPTLNCDCDACSSPHNNDKRLRTSLLLTLSTASPNLPTLILIEASPDVRLQALRRDINRLSAIFPSSPEWHCICGVAEMREINEASKSFIDVYSVEPVITALQKQFSYLFKTTQVGGGKPKLTLQTVEEFQTFTTGVEECTVFPCDINTDGDKDKDPKNKQSRSVGLCVRNFAYIPPTLALPDASLKLLAQRKISTLVVGVAARECADARELVDPSLRIIDALKPERAFLVNIPHFVTHSKLQEILPPNVNVAHDSMMVPL
eukprot:TRINITY_DN14863_c0_g1_i1.p1 TRINITY_DN14863_c0_g1~~TRINITY_DN14863_c0_g1_i1.p1  ORF type:complete len:305 (+),score=79.35 TRINITY_DN14863_c0_g1_i1:2-916(+)